MGIKNRKSDLPQYGSAIGMLNAAFHQTTTRVYQVTESIIWGLIVASVAFLCIELFAFERGELPRWMEIVDTGILWCFAAELLLRVLAFGPKETKLFRGGPIWTLRAHFFGRLRYLFQPLQLLDLLVVLTLHPALRGLRVLRFLRLARGIKFFRYSNPFMGIIRTFQENALLYIFTFSFLVCVVMLGGLSFYFVEVGTNPKVESPADGLWWALVTLTTVGYGDIIPSSQPLGRVIGGVVMVLGMFTLALFAGIVGSTLLRVLMSLKQDQFRMSNYANHIVICGFDEAGAILLDAIVAELDMEKNEVIVFSQGDRPTDLSPEFIWIDGDPSKENELDKVRMAYAKAAIVVGSRKQAPSHADAMSIMITFTIRSYLKKQLEAQRRNQDLYIVTEILVPENVDHARIAGADEIIETTKLGYSLMAHATIVPGTGTVMSRVATAGAHSLYIGQNPENELLSYHELAERVNTKYGIALIGIRAPGNGKIALDPDDNESIDPKNHLVYLARGPVLPEA